MSDGGLVEVGRNTYFTGKINIACIEGKKIQIGEGCLFSNDITMRTSDSYSILNIENERINSATDIKIDNHVWVGLGAPKQEEWMALWLV